MLTREAKACIVLGDNASFIADFFKNKDYHKFTIVENMEDAVKQAREFAKGGDTILLNPGYASFGYFRDFEERGEAFKNAALWN